MTAESAATEVQDGERRPAIVVGVSGSPASARALRWAADEASRRHGQLRVVLIWTAAHRASYAPPLPDAQQQVLTASHVLAATMRAVLGPALPDDLTAEIAEGTPERALVERSAGADLLVLGSASAHALTGPAIGPVIRTCLSRAHCPVVVVGPEESSGEDQARLGATLAVAAQR